MRNQGRKIKELNELKRELEFITQTLRNYHTPHERAALIEKFKMGLNQLRRGILEL